MENDDYRRIQAAQSECCAHYNANFLPPKPEQLVVISDGVYEGIIPVEGVRYPSPYHMSGWWLTTEKFNGDTSSLITVHYGHVMEKRPDIAIYMALPCGYRFVLGGDDDSVWFDESASREEP